jgi:ferredoxin/flavodoxin
MNIAILYYSAAGGTRLVAELLGELLTPLAVTTVISIEKETAAKAIRDADFSILCFPTWFLKPAKLMRDFVAGLDLRDRPTRVYLVATYEFYPENAARVLALMLAERGASVAGSMAIRAPGSDLTCVLPDWLVPGLYRFEARLETKLTAIVEEIRVCTSTEGSGGAIPRPKWYTPFAWLLQRLLLDRFIESRFRIRALEDRCNGCGACVAGCHRGAWILEGGAPRHRAEGCDLCTRCIHHCPKKAIVLVEAFKDNRRLDARLYRSLGEAARRGLAS